jgi:hypothetical protein
MEDTEGHSTAAQAPQHPCNWMDGESPFLVRVKKETQFMEQFVRRST